MKTLVAIVSGAVLATSLILACSDDSPSDADAAACDCPAAEAPLVDRLVTIRGLDDTLPANARSGAIASCAAGSTLITGHCLIVDSAGTPPNAALREFGPLDALRWGCSWDNFNGGSAVIHAEAVCLVPAS